MVAEPATGAPPSSDMTTDYFLKIEGISGESSDSKHKNEIELEAFSWGETNTGCATSGGGAGAGKVQMQDLSFTMTVNKASPRLLLSCASGKHIKQAVLTARKAGKTQQEYLIIKLSDVLVTSYQTGGSAQAEIPFDQVSLGFRKIHMEYRPQKADGSLDTPIQVGWDVVQNKAI
jgi:type VI secretion system secreted protein Hcp